MAFYSFHKQNKFWKAISSYAKRRISLNPEASQAGHRFFARPALSEVEGAQNDKPVRGYCRHTLFGNFLDGDIYVFTL